MILILLLLLLGLTVSSTAKDHELRQAVKEKDAQLIQATQALAEFKHRAHTAEVSKLAFISFLVNEKYPDAVGRELC